MTFEEKSGMKIQLFMQSATRIEAVSTMRTSVSPCIEHILHCDSTHTTENGVIRINRDRAKRMIGTLLMALITSPPGITGSAAVRNDVHR